MPTLTNARHETFAQELAKGHSQQQAYVTAGYRPHVSNPSNLAKDKRIQARVADILSERQQINAKASEKAAERLSVTVASLISEAEEVRLAAMSAGQFAPAISAIKEKGILAGVRVEKREQTNRNLNDMSDDELARIAFGSGEGDAAPSSGPSLLN